MTKWFIYTIFNGVFWFEGKEKSPKSLENSWGLPDRTPLARQPLLMQKSLLEWPDLPQRPCHSLQGENGSDLKPILSKGRMADTFQNPTMTTSREKLSKLQTQEYQDSSLSNSGPLESLSRRRQSSSKRQTSPAPSHRSDIWKS